jgi:hypothetical protein
MKRAMAVLRKQSAIEELIDEQWQRPTAWEMDPATPPGRGATHAVVSVHTRSPCSNLTF